MGNDTILDLANSLKSERIQLKSERIQLKSERIQERLEEILGWVISEGDAELAKTYQLSSSRAAVAFAAFVARPRRSSWPGEVPAGKNFVCAPPSEVPGIAQGYCTTSRNNSVGAVVMAST